MAIWYDRNDALGLTLDGKAGLSVAGTVYAKSAQLTLNGSGTATTGSCTSADLCSTVVVGSFKLDGNNTVTVDDQGGSNLALGLPALNR
jgi:hypothetical protein